MSAATEAAAVPSAPSTSPSQPCEGVLDAIGKLFKVADETREAQEREVYLAREARLRHYKQQLQREYETMEAQLRILECGVVEQKPDVSYSELRLLWRCDGEQKVHMEQVSCIDTMQDSSHRLLMASCSFDGTVVVQACPTEASSGGHLPSLVGLLEGSAGEALNAVTFVPAPSLPGGWAIAAGGVAHVVEVWPGTVATGDTEKMETFGVTKPVTALAGAPCGTLAAATGSTVEVWDLTASSQGGSATSRNLQHPGPVAGVRAPSEALVVTLCASGAEQPPGQDPPRGSAPLLTIWDVRERGYACRIPTSGLPAGAACSFDAVAYSRGAGVLLAAAAGNDFEAWDMRRVLRPMEQATLDMPGSPATVLSLSSSGAGAAAVGCAGEAAVLVSDFHGGVAFTPCGTGLSYVPGTLMWSPGRDADARQNSAHGTLAAGDANGNVWGLGLVPHSVLLV